MAHSHAHGEGAGGNYFLDQLFTILVCGALGIVAVAMYKTEMLQRFLAPMFFVPVLLGGIVIMGMVLLRAVAVWKLAGEAQTKSAPADLGHGHSHGHEHNHGHEHSHGSTKEDCGHEHAHGEACQHEHNHSHSHAHAHSHATDPDEDHGHSHGDDEHGWTPLRYGILLIPVVLFALGLPRNGFVSEARFNADREAAAVNPKRVALANLAGAAALTPVLRKTVPDTRYLPFKELAGVAGSMSRQELYEGDIGVLRGQFMPLKEGGGTRFTLFRMNMTCCAADAIPLEIRIESPDAQALQGIRQGEWIEVKGIITFQRLEAKRQWIPVLMITSNDDIRLTAPTNSLEEF